MTAHGDSGPTIAHCDSASAPLETSGNNLILTEFLGIPSQLTDVIPGYFHPKPVHCKPTILRARAV
jgi:hypothetical protein